MPQTTDDISFRSSSLLSYEKCPRMFVADWIVAKGLVSHIAPDLRHKPQNVGAAVGIACHEGRGYLMNAIAQTGEHGGSGRMRHALDIGHASISDQFAVEKIGTDTTTPTAEAASEATAKIIRRIFQETKPSIRPLLVEKGFKASYSYMRNDTKETVSITGTVDLYLLERLLDDLKTGRHQPMPVTQMGTYDNILEANGLPVEVLQAHYFKRVPTNSLQPAGKIIPIDRAFAKSHAKKVAVHAHRDVSQMLKTGRSNHIMPRADHFLCDPRFCSAFGTSFCKLGALVHPNRKAS